MKQKIYLCGAIDHTDIDKSRKEFKMAADYWQLKGYDVFNPFENGLPDDVDLHKKMRCDLCELTQCDIIYLLRGWERSWGVRLGLDIAAACGLTVWFETNNRE